MTTAAKGDRLGHLTYEGRTPVEGLCYCTIVHAHDVGATAPAAPDLDGDHHHGRETPASFADLLAAVTKACLTGEGDLDAAAAALAAEFGEDGAHQVFSKACGCEWHLLYPCSSHKDRDEDGSG